MSFPALTTALARFREQQPPDARVVVACSLVEQHRVRRDVAILDPCGAVTEVAASRAVPIGDVYLIRKPEEELPVLYDVTGPYPTGRDSWRMDVTIPLPQLRDVARFAQVT